MSTRQVERGLPALTYEQELVVYRVAQEALTNVVRHAAATAPSSPSSETADQLELRVRDDGRGLRGARLPGGGIRGMRERALLVRGRPQSRERPGGGVEVALDLPFEGRP